jgi:hypothetical protein
MTEWYRSSISDAPIYAVEIADEKGIVLRHFTEMKEPLPGRLLFCGAGIPKDMKEPDEVHRTCDKCADRAAAIKLVVKAEPVVIPELELLKDLDFGLPKLAEPEDISLSSVLSTLNSIDQFTPVSDVRELLARRYK